jgi:Cd2+/Zn2+-exporting ATPase
MTDSPAKVAEAIKVARKTHRVVWQNIVMVFLIKAVFVVMGIAGVATMWEAVFADIGVALMAVFNSRRALKI